MANVKHALGPATIVTPITRGLFDSAELDLIKSSPAASRIFARMTTSRTEPS